MFFSDLKLWCLSVRWNLFKKIPPMGLGHALNIRYLFKCFVELEPSRSS